MGRVHVEGPLRRRVLRPGRSQPGETGWVTLAPKARGLLVVPSSAVLQSPRGPYVLAAATERGAFHQPPG